VARSPQPSAAGAAAVRAGRVPMGTNLSDHLILETNNPGSATWIKCPRSDSHLTYMIDIALTTEFALEAGGGP
jgi:hypothetical protein